MANKSVAYINLIYSIPIELFYSIHFIYIFPRSFYCKILHFCINLFFFFSYIFFLNLFHHLYIRLSYIQFCEEKIVKWYSKMQFIFHTLESTKKISWASFSKLVNYYGIWIIKAFVLPRWILIFRFIKNSLCRIFLNKMINFVIFLSEFWIFLKQNKGIITKAFI